MSGFNPFRVVADGCLPRVGAAAPILGYMMATPAGLQKSPNTLNAVATGGVDIEGDLLFASRTRTTSCPGHPEMEIKIYG